MIFETLERRPVFVVMVLRSDASEPEFVEVCSLPTIGDCIPSIDGWLRVSKVYLQRYHGDVHAIACAAPVER